MRKQFVKTCHDGLGHLGVKRTLRAIAARAWWPRMHVEVKGVVGKCPTCLFNKETNYRGAQRIPESGDAPWTYLQMDIVHMCESRSGKEKALVLYDRFTKGVQAYPVTANCTSEDVLNILIFEVVPRVGWPRVIYTDRGSNFIAARARAWFEAMGIRLVVADAHMHTAVAGAERFNHSLREIARAAHFDHGFEWDLLLPMIVSWYNSLVQTSTGFSPFYLDHGRDPLTPWDIKNGPKPAATEETVPEVD